MVSDMDLSSHDTIIKRLQTAGVWSKKALGQHFLIDRTSLESIVDAAHITPEDTIVEIGPGMGVLSRELLSRAGRVVAFEYDIEMVKILAEDLPELDVILGDVLQTAPDVVKELESYKVVANIPYQITSPILKLFLEGVIQPIPTSMTLLVQKEVGKRLAAPASKPGRGYLSVLAQYFSEVRYVKDVPAAAFWPQPKVDSAVIHLELKLERLFSGKEEIAFLKFVKTLFIQPRKQLKNVVAGIKGVPAAEIEEYFGTIGLKNSVRAQELNLEQWAQLYTKPFSK